MMHITVNFTWQSRCTSTSTMHAVVNDAVNFIRTLFPVNSAIARYFITGSSLMKRGMSTEVTCELSAHTAVG